jgi:hypothetical protein
MTDEEMARIEIAWKYFDLHAKQRTTMFQFFTAMVPAVVGGYFYLAKDHAYFGTLMVVACIGLALSLGFWLIDQRNEQLVNISRKHICELETALLYKDGTYPGIFNTADRAEAPFLGLARFRCIMSALYILATLAFLGLAYNAWNTASAPASTQSTSAK